MVDKLEIHLKKSNRIKYEYLPTYIREGANEDTKIKNQPETLKENEEEKIFQTLIEYNKNRTKTAEALGISRSTLIRKIKVYGLEYLNEKK